MRQISMFPLNETGQAELLVTTLVLARETKDLLHHKLSTGIAAADHRHRRYLKQFSRQVVVSEEHASLGCERP
jgi:hypothetical protein